MEPYETEDRNLMLTGGEGVGDLPAVRGEDAHGNPCIRTYWRATEGEQKALANGAPLQLTLALDGVVNRFPPVALSVGEPGEAAEPLLAAPHVMRAMGWLYGKLMELDAVFRESDVHAGSLDEPEAPEEERIPDFIQTGRPVAMAAEDFVKFWEQALRETWQDPTEQEVD